MFSFVTVIFSVQVSPVALASIGPIRRDLGCSIVNGPCVKRNFSIVASYGAYRFDSGEQLY